MPITLRPFDAATDLPRLADLINAEEPEPISVDLLREWEQRPPAGRIRGRWAAVADGGLVVGVGEATRDPWMPDGRFLLWVDVDAAWRGRGIGARLYDAVLAFALAQGATSLEGMARDDDPASLRFAEQRGFAVDRHLFPSVLDVAGFDEGRFAGLIERLEASGLRFFTLADLGDTPAARRRLYELNRRLALDIPGRGPDFAPFEVFQQRVFGASWYRADGQIVAADGEHWVGLAAVGYFAHTNSLYNLITGVERDYRRRGLAQALKLLTIRCARRHGAISMRANNDSLNVPMLAVNRKLGYRPLPGKYRLVASCQLPVASDEQ